MLTTRVDSSLITTHSLGEEVDENSMGNLADMEMMVIDIAFGSHGKHDEIVVHYGDDPIELAKLFLSKHSLKSELLPKVTSHIEEAIENFKESNVELMAQSPTFDNMNKTKDSVTCCNESLLQNHEVIEPIDLPDCWLNHDLISPKTIRPDAKLLDCSDTKDISSDLDLTTIEIVDPDHSKIFTQEIKSSELFDRVKSHWNVGAKNRSKTKNHFLNQEAKIPMEFDEHLSKRSSILLVRNSTSNQLGKSNISNNRLYLHALSKQRHQQLQILQAEERQRDELFHSQYRLSKKSQKVCTTRPLVEDVATRLYKEGMKRKEKNKKPSTNQLNSRTLENNKWSCVKCGTYHVISSSDSMFGTRTVMVYQCNNCGWKSLSDRHPLNENTFKPIIITDRFGKNRTENRKKMVLSSQNRNVYSYLFENTDHQKSVLKDLKKALNEESREHTFRPDIPQSSVVLLSGCKVQQDERTSHFEKYFQQPVSERLFNSVLKTKKLFPQNVVNSNVVAESIEFGSDKKESNQSKKSICKLINRLTYEYINRKARKEAVSLIQREFDSNGRKLFIPKIGPLPATLAHDDDQNLNEPIHEKLLRKGEERKKRKEQLMKSEMAKEREKNCLHILPRSGEILSNSLRNSIDELFRILLACQQIKISSNVYEMNLSEDLEEGADSPVLITKLSNHLENYKEMKLDMRSIEPEILIPEIHDILLDVQQNVLSRCVAYDNHKNIGYECGYDEFQQLILSYLKMRNGIGKSYLAIVKPRDTVVKLALEEELKECTFHPRIIQKSIILAERRGRNGVKSIEDILLSDGMEVQKGIEQVRKQVQNNYMKCCTFSPQLIPAPRTINPQYKYTSPKSKNNSLTSDERNILPNSM